MDKIPNFLLINPLPRKTLSPEVSLETDDLNTFLDKSSIIKASQALARLNHYCLI